MIDFRYHVVSIVAVFLALTVGLVIGSSFLSKVAYDELNNQLSGLRGQNQALHSTQTDLQAQIHDRDSLINALGPDAVAGKLSGQTVGVIVLPGADRAIGDATVELLAKAGADVPVELYVKSSLTDPSQASKVAAATAQAAVIRSSTGASATATSVPTISTPAAAPARAFADLAQAMLRKAPLASDGTPTAPRLTNPQAAAVLKAYSDAGFVDVKTVDTADADLMVVVAPSPGEQPAADVDNAYYLGLVKDLDAGRGTVIAGPATSATSPGLIAAAVKDSWASRNVSTADSADQPAGRIVTVYALAEELTSKTGHYGLTGADGPLPNLH